MQLNAKELPTEYDAICQSYLEAMEDEVDILSSAEFGFGQSITFFKRLLRNYFEFSYGFF
jgi:hypothetical protein